MKKRERFVYIVLFLLGLGAMGYALLGSDGVPEVRRLQREIAALRDEIEALEAKQQELTRQVGLMRDDPVTIERKAREELKMVRKGETVILLEKKD